MEEGGTAWIHRLPDIGVQACRIKSHNGPIGNHLSRFFRVYYLYAQNHDPSLVERSSEQGGRKTFN